MGKDDVLSGMVEIRRDIHKHAETAWKEFRTTSVVARRLIDIGFEVKVGAEFIDIGHAIGRFVDMQAEKARAESQGADPAMLERMGPLTGCLAELRTGRPGPVSAFRFDIDANDVTESSDKGHRPFDDGFVSINGASMHACAHDGHTSLGIAFAEWLKDNEKDLCGSFRLIFQPAEEGVRGGYAAWKSGVVDGVDLFFALHLGLGYPTGTVVCGADGLLGTSKFDVRFKGISAHAGVEPNKGRNALLAAAQAALGMHSIAPHKDGRTRLNVGVLTAGEGRNVVPAIAEIKVETRGESARLAEYMYDRAIEVAQGAAAMYGVEMEVIKQGESLCADSDPDLAALVHKAADGLEGVLKLDMNGRMAGSDDASWFMEAVRQSGGKATYIIVGADLAAGHHNHMFDFDESSLRIAYGLLGNIALRICDKLA